MLTPYQFASNTPIAAIDLDGLEALTRQDYQLIVDNHDPKLGNIIYINPAQSIHPGGTSPPPICCDFGYGTEDRNGRQVNRAGLSDAPKIHVFEPDADGEGQRIRVVDNYSSQYRLWVLTKADEYNDRFNVEAASLFGPSLIGKILPGFIQGGKYSIKFLGNKSKIIPGIGVQRFSIKNATSGFKNSGVQEKFTKHFRGIKNSINDHLGDSDLTGAIKDIHGFESGGNHILEVTQALQGLKGNRKQIQKLIDDGLISGEALKAADGALRAADNAIFRVRQVLKSAERSRKLHVRDGGL